MSTEELDRLDALITSARSAINQARFAQVVSIYSCSYGDFCMYFYSDRDPIVETYNDSPMDFVISFDYDVIDLADDIMAVLSENSANSIKNVKVKFV